MGAGGWAYGYYSYSGDDGNGPVPSTGAERWAKGIHEKMKEDKNVLYTVAKEGEALYSNSDTLTASTTAAQLPEGYGFLLQFDGEKVRAWKATATTASRASTSPISGMSPAIRTSPWTRRGARSR